jgi:predicted Zn finger-like uncharacterized protein
MILTCPECATRYEADAAKFQPGGRKVRCAKCGHTWHQPPAAPDADSVVLAAETPVAAPAEMESAAASPVVQPPAETAMTAAETPKAGMGWRTGALAGWAALIVVVALLIGITIKFRQEIVSVWPQTSTFYAAAGLDVNTVGLAFQDVSYRVTSEDDLPILHIRGKVVNITKRELAVPQIEASLTDESRRELYDWKIKADASNLKPGKTAAFSARLPSPPSSARHVDLKFVKG